MKKLIITLVIIFITISSLNSQSSKCISNIVNAKKTTKIDLKLNIGLRVFDSDDSKSIIPINNKYNFEFIDENIFSRSEEENHQSFSFGGGVFFSGINTIPVISLSTTFQFSKKILLEINYDYCAGKLHNSDIYNTQIYSLILQTCFNLNDNKWKLYTGIGLGLASINKFGIYFPAGDAKIEYNFNKWFSVNTECMFFLTQSMDNIESTKVPVLLKLNSNFKLPY